MRKRACGVRRSSAQHKALDYRTIVGLVITSSNWSAGPWWWTNVLFYFFKDRFQSGTWNITLWMSGIVLFWFHRTVQSGVCVCEGCWCCSSNELNVIISESCAHVIFVLIAVQKVPLVSRRKINHGRWFSLGFSISFFIVTSDWFQWMSMDIVRLKSSSSTLSDRPRPSAAPRSPVITPTVRKARGGLRWLRGVCSRMTRRRRFVRRKWRKRTRKKWCKRSGKLRQAALAGIFGWWTADRRRGWKLWSGDEDRTPVAALWTWVPSISRGPRQ